MGARGRKARGGRLGWIDAGWASAGADHDKYVLPYIATDKNVLRPYGLLRQGCPSKPDTGDVPLGDSNIFVDVSLHIYKNVAQFDDPDRRDRPIS
jgi:hypothetical protein